MISRFANCRGDLRLRTADTLARELGLLAIDAVEFEQHFLDRWAEWFRKASFKAHPDHGGSAEHQAILNEVHAAVKEAFSLAEFAEKVRKRNFSEESE